MPPLQVPLYLRGDIVGLAHGLVEMNQVRWLRQRPFPIGKVQRERRGAAVFHRRRTSRFLKICSQLSFPEIAGRTWKSGNLVMARTAVFRVVCVQTERPGLGVSGHGRKWWLTAGRHSGHVSTSAKCINNIGLGSERD
jgi:hypothetical protein